MRMPFGKYKGVEVSDVPRDYLIWLRDNVNLFGPLKSEVDRIFNSDGQQELIGASVADELPDESEYDFVRLQVRTKAELLDIIYKNSNVKFSRASFKIKNPRMRQVAMILENQTVDQNELRFFEQEILAYQEKAQVSHAKREKFFRQAARFYS